MQENLNILYKAIGKNIKEYRKINKIGQKDLAKHISLSRSSLSNIETGTHQPSIFTIYEIAIALDCSLDDLLPSIDNYKKLNYFIEEKYRIILDEFTSEISKKNIDISTSERGTELGKKTIETIKELLKSKKDDK